MSVSFSRTLRSLRTDRQPWVFAGLTSLLVVPIAIVWLFLAKISVYEVSSSARIEVLTTSNIVAAEVEGRIVESKLHIGMQTHSGDVVLTLDDTNVRRSMDELLQQISSDQAKHLVILKEVTAKEQSLAAQANARTLAVQESQSQLEAAKTAAQFALQSFQRTAKLATQNAASPTDVEKTLAEAETAKAMVETSRLKVVVGEQDRLANEKLQEAELAGIQRDAAELEGAVAIHHATLRRLEHELELRTIKARIAGRVEEVVPIRVGSVVRPAEKLATIVPPGEPRIVAMLPVISVGRVVAGQPARLRLDGYPWTQYGTLAATVTGVGNEPANGLIRVELSITPNSTSQIPLQYGQTGVVEIEVEQSSPAMLILRAAGESLRTQRRAAGAR